MGEFCDPFPLEATASFQREPVGATPSGWSALKVTETCHCFGKICGVALACGGWMGNLLQLCAAGWQCNPVIPPDTLCVMQHFASACMSCRLFRELWANGSGFPQPRHSTHSNHPRSCPVSGVLVQISRHCSYSYDLNAGPYSRSKPLASVDWSSLVFME